MVGISDDRQPLCFALALWNGKDPILKVRLFGLTNGEGNQGADVVTAIALGNPAIWAAVGGGAGLLAGGLIGHSKEK